MVVHNNRRNVMLFKVYLHLSDVIVGIFIDENSQLVCQRHSSCVCFSFLLSYILITACIVNLNMSGTIMCLCFFRVQLAAHCR